MEGEWRGKGKSEDRGNGEREKQNQLLTLELTHYQRKFPYFLVGLTKLSRLVQIPAELLSEIFCRYPSYSRQT